MKLGAIGSAASAMAPVAVTMALLAGCTQQQMQQAVVDGQLFCAVHTASGDAVVALADASGVPVTVTGKAHATVNAACAVIGGIPAMPPVTPGSAPMVAAKVPVG